MTPPRDPELSSTNIRVPDDEDEQRQQRFGRGTKMCTVLALSFVAGSAFEIKTGFGNNILYPDNAPVIAQSGSVTATTEAVPTPVAPPIETVPAPAAEPAPPTPPVIAPGATPATPESAPAAPAPAKPEAKPTTTAGCIAALPLKIKVGQLIMAGVSGHNLAQARPVFDKHNIGGAVIYSPTKNLTSAGTAKFKQSLIIPRILATDEEGGRVQRFPQFGRLHSAEQMAAKYKNNPVGLEKVITKHGLKLKQLGIDVVLGPVVDINPLQEIGKKKKSGPMGDRAFSSQPDQVIKYSTAVVRGWQKAGLDPVLKHWPNHGDATGDTHLGPATTAYGVDTMKGWDWLPYKAFSNDSSVGVMVGHLKVPGFGNAPASVNQGLVKGYLRNSLGYKNHLAYSDSTTMAGVGMPVAKAAVESIAAGVDVIITDGRKDMGVLNRELATMTSELKKAVTTGVISQDRINAAVTRILRQKGVSNPCSLL